MHREGNQPRKLAPLIALVEGWAVDCCFQETICFTRYRSRKSPCQRSCFHMGPSLPLGSSQVELGPPSPCLLRRRSSHFCENICLQNAWCLINCGGEEIGIDSEQDIGGMPLHLGAGRLSRAILLPRPVGSGILLHPAPVPFLSPSSVIKNTCNSAVP